MQLEAFFFFLAGYFLCIQTVQDNAISSLSCLGIFAQPNGSLSSPPLTNMLLYAAQQPIMYIRVTNHLASDDK